jgi:hypothetical protein
MDGALLDMQLAWVELVTGDSKLQLRPVTVAHGAAVTGFSTTAYAKG